MAQVTPRPSPLSPLRDDAALLLLQALLSAGLQQRHAVMARIPFSSRCWRVRLSATTSRRVHGFARYTGTTAVMAAGALPDVPLAQVFCADDCTWLANYGGR